MTPTLEFAIPTMEDQELAVLTKQASLLIYHLNKKRLREFVMDARNMYIIEYFYNKRGIDQTDPLEEKPICRTE